MSDNVITFPEPGEATPMRKAKKAAKTRARNAHKRAAMSKARSAVKIDHAAIDAKRAKAYFEMENSVCDLSRASPLAMIRADHYPGPPASHPGGFSLPRPRHAGEPCAGTDRPAHEPAETGLTQRGKRFLPLV
jgi:hypothetical protein